MDIVNTSYDQSYVIVSKTANSVTLRLVDDTDLYATYWKKFISAKVYDPSDKIYIIVTDAPDELVRSTVYAPYNLTYPKVVLRSTALTHDVDLTKYVTSNKPDESLAGLFTIDYNLRLDDSYSIIIWRSFLSIEEPPLLRKSITTWNRTNYTIQTLNRLVIEPAFIDAVNKLNTVYNGYSIVTENRCIKSSKIDKYKVKSVVVISSDSILVESQSELPLSTRITLEGITADLDYTLMSEDYSPQGILYFDENTHACSYKSYGHGDIANSNGSTYYCVRTTDSSPSDESSDWVRGTLYKVTSQPDLTAMIGKVIIPDEVLTKVDSNGYIFLVDLMKVNYQFSYRGYYDRKSFADYNTNDLVTYVSENVVYLVRRLNTDINNNDNDEHSPISYKNPNWSVVYSVSSNSSSNEFDKFGIKFSANSTNSFISKTYSVSDYMCRVYARLLRIPDELVELLGTKSSVLLYNLLSRTRNTPNGLRIALNAIGLDLESLNLSDPSYEYVTGFSGDYFDDVDNLNMIRTDIDKLMTADQMNDPNFVPTEGQLKYVVVDNESTKIQRYSGGSWSDVYEFVDLNDPNSNNAYYDADIKLLDRLSRSGTEVIDDITYVNNTSMIEKLSKSLNIVLRYEIPIYILMKLRIYYLEKVCISYYGKSAGFVNYSVSTSDKNVLIVHELLMFDEDYRRFVSVPSNLYDYTDPSNPVLIDPTKMITELTGGGFTHTRIYEFTESRTALRIVPADPSIESIDHYWRSVNTLGLFGATISGTWTDIGDITDDRDLTIANGVTEITPYFHYSSAKISSAQFLKWNYIFEDLDSADLQDELNEDLLQDELNINTLIDEQPGDDVWHLSSEMPFASLTDEIEDTNTLSRLITLSLERLMSYNDLLAFTSKIRDREGNQVTFEVDNSVLKLIGTVDTQFKMFDSSNNRLATINFNFISSDRAVKDPEDLSDLSDEISKVANIGGRYYGLVKIGNQIWTTENISFINSAISLGTEGSGITDPTAWYYNNDEEIYGLDGRRTGLLYNWHAVKYIEDNKSTLIPGWHVPTNDEWNTLITLIGGNSQGDKLKAEDGSVIPGFPSGWNGIDDLGLKITPSGERSPSGLFSNANDHATFWTSTIYSGSDVYATSFTDSSTITTPYKDNGHGFSLRLVKDNDQFDPVSTRVIKFKNG